MNRRKEVKVGDLEEIIPHWISVGFPTIKIKHLTLNLQRSCIHYNSFKIRLKACSSLYFTVILLLLDSILSHCLVSFYHSLFQNFQSTYVHKFFICWMCPQICIDINRTFTCSCETLINHKTITFLFVLKMLQLIFSSKVVVPVWHFWYGHSELVILFLYYHHLCFIQVKGWKFSSLLFLTTTCHFRALLICIVGLLGPSQLHWTPTSQCFQGFLLGLLSVYRSTSYHTNRQSPIWCYLSCGVNTGVRLQE